MRFNRKTLLLRSASMVALGAVAWLGAAQIAAAADAPVATAKASAAAAAASSSDVVVTAGRRDQALQKVPAAVAAVTNDKIERAGIQSFTDVANITPSLNITEVGAGRFINIRGIGIAVATPFQTAGVPLHVDGLYIPNSGFFGRDAFFDLEGIEVYRGPQGTFAGQNSTGGAIFLRTKQPQFDDFGAQVQQLVGNFQWLQTQGWVNLPISSTMAARLSFQTESRDSFYTDLGPGGQLGTSQNYDKTNRPGNINRQVLRAQLRWRPNDRLDVTVKGDMTHAYDDATIAIRAAPNSFNDTSKLINPWVINTDVPQQGKLDLFRGTLNMKYHANDIFDVKFVGGGQFYRNLTVTDNDFTSPFVTPAYAPAPLNQSIGHFKTDDNYWFGEFDVVSNSAGKLNWVAGLTGFTQITEQFSEASNYNVGNCTPVGATAPGATCTTPNLINGGSWLDYHQKGHSWATFGEATYNFNEHFQAIAGGRWTDYEIDLVPGSTVTNAIPPHALLQCGTVSPTDPTPNLCNVYGAGKYSRFTGRVALNWFPTTDTTVYATFSQGMKPGSFFSQFTLGESHATQVAKGETQYKSETLRNYEVGIKTRLLDRHLTTNLTAFYDDYRDYQASFAIPNTFIPRSVNIPKSRTYGVEFEAHASMNDLRIDGTAAYLNSKIQTGLPVGVTGLAVTKGYYGSGNGTAASICPNAPTVTFPCTGTGAVLPTDVKFINGTNFFDPTGEPLNYSPKVTANASIEYDIHLPTGMLTPHLQVQYIGAQWASLYHGSQDKQPAYHTLDFRLTYQAPEHWRVEGFVTNLTNELYVEGVAPGAPTYGVGPAASTVVSGATGSIGLGAPRQFGMRFQYTY